MRFAFLAVAASLLACASVQADKGGKAYTCIPNEAMDRGPFQPKPAGGEKLVIRGEQSEVKVADKQ